MSWHLVHSVLLPPKNAIDYQCSALLEALSLRPRNASRQHLIVILTAEYLTAFLLDTNYYNRSSDAR